MPLNLPFLAIAMWDLKLTGNWGCAAANWLHPEPWPVPSTKATWTTLPPDTFRLIVPLC